MLLEKKKRIVEKIKLALDYYQIIFILFDYCYFLLQGYTNVILSIVTAYL